MSTPLPLRAIFWPIVLAIVILLTLLIVPTVGRVSETAHRTVEAANLREIAQANLIYAMDHNDNLPVAADVWDYARILADESGLNTPAIWLSKNDPAWDATTTVPATIVITDAAKPRPLDPAFRQLKPSVAVALGKLNSRMPATTPIAWTRGLQPDGTWSPHSPNGTHGGFVTFIGGNTSFFKDLTSNGGELVRFDRKGSTANILDALPPGTRIGEYTPTPDEQTAWAKSIAWRQKLGPLKPYTPPLFLAILWLPFVAISVYRLLKRQRGAFLVLLWPVAFSVVLFLLTPGCW
ncbi:MAG: hypothetical protein K0R17_1708 [Rariglobus sp.]|jgi:type II secretory pathway pseudopilin PulG|nr:hypothetical protein [Rariglobus sp.]